MGGPNYCRIVDGEQKKHVARTRVIPTCPAFERCFPYPAGTVVFLVDMSIASAHDASAYAEAKHEGSGGKEIWRVDFTDPSLVTKPDKTKGAWNGAVVAYGPVVLPADAVFTKLYSGASVSGMSTQPKVSEGLPADPVNRGWVMGWGVYRMEPWHLVGVCASSGKADKMKGEAGSDYVAAYGSHRLGSDDFVEGSSQVGA
jgi:hypothetical protein